MSNLLTNASIHLALCCYVVGLLWTCLGRPPEWQRAARAVWIVGCGLFLVHVVAAFHFHYGWSHTIALQDTARQTAELTGVDSGAGLYLNYLFTLLWVVDAGLWGYNLERYRTRSAGYGLALHAFFLFMAIHATVVFEDGWVRWVSVAVLLAGMIFLAVVFRRRRSAS